jgi:hypothetical protein
VKPPVYLKNIVIYMARTSGYYKTMLKTKNKNFFLNTFPNTTSSYKNKHDYPSKLYLCNNRISISTHLTIFQPCSVLLNFKNHILKLFNSKHTHVEYKAPYYFMLHLYLPCIPISRTYIPFDLTKIFKTIFQF